LIRLAGIWLLIVEVNLIRLLQRAGVLAVLTIATGALLPAQNASLRAGFEAPPQTAKLRCYWWWLNGNTTVAAITRDLTAMKAKGYGGAILVDANGSDQGGNRDVAAGPRFGSPQWVKLYLHALAVAKQLRLVISLNAMSGWNLGGPGVTPEDAAKVLTYSRTIVAGGGTRSVRLAMPAEKEGFYRQIAVLAYPLQHGPALAGEAGSGRRAIYDLDYKTAGEPKGISMPLSSKLLRDLAPESGEEDLRSRDVVDLSARVANDGTLQWTFPAGTWEVLRIGYTDSGARVSTSSDTWQGLMMDYMSRTALSDYWNRVLKPLIVDAKPYVGSSLRYVVEDSWEETGGGNWTEGFRAEFIKRRGYDPLPYLPAVAGRIVDSRDTTNRFLADLRRTVADMIASNHYGYFAELAAKYGLGTHPEAGGPHGTPIDALENFRDSSFPQTEFWVMSKFHRVTPEERFYVKEAASAAHIYGKPYAAAEGFTSLSLPWSESPGLNLKPTFDQALTEGLNRLYWHEFTSEPKAAGLPGQEYFAGTHLNRNATWWKQAGPVLLALNRAQFLMQQGRSVSDLLYFRGNDVPGFARLKSDDPAHVLPGYDYDVISDDALLHRMLVKHGMLETPEGLRYRALALPRSGRMSLASLMWVEKYVRDGGLVIGPRPLGAPGLLNPSEEKQYAAISGRMWRGCAQGAIATYGAGRIYCEANAHAALQAFGVAADFESKGDGQFDFVHRQTSNADIYFVRNTENSPAAAMLSFRVHGRVPELWHMDSGVITAAPVYRESHGRTEIPLSFPAYGSVFIVFEGAPRTHAVRIVHDGTEVLPSIVAGAGLFADAQGKVEAVEPGSYTVDMSDGTSRGFVVSQGMNRPAFSSDWRLSFPPGWGAPASLPWKKFDSWTESSDSGIRYFSGTASYHGSLLASPVSLTQGRQLWMDLGSVREIATVLINGKTVGTFWHPPFRVRIDRELHSGTNSIEIDVTNLWANRLIGDKQPGARHYGSTNIIQYKSDSQLIPSGLLTRPRVYAVEVLRESRGSADR
jgi:(4-O-methyl)-D-glucuronate---lignin esterase